MPLTLVLPRLLPDPASPPLEDLPSLPATADLLTRPGGREAIDPGYHAWLARTFGYAGEARAPLAAARLAGEGGDPGDRTWTCLDPVTLLARLDDVAMAAEPPEFDAVEADALLAALAAHFAADGIELRRTTPGRWYAGTAATTDLVAVPVARVRGRPIAPHLPSGADRGQWLRRASEAEMLLHAHPVNLARERAGGPTVNGVWPWGAGRLAAPPYAPYAAVCADEPCARGLAAASGARVQRTPASLSDLAPGEAATLVVVGDPETRADPSASERDWVAPLRRLLDGPGAPRIELVVGLGPRMARLRPPRCGWTRRLAPWRRAPSIAQALRAMT